MHVAASEENPVEIDCDFDRDSADVENNILNKYVETDTTRQSMISSISSASSVTENGKRIVDKDKVEGFSVAFDPLDGSSIVDANFAVGTIMGIWPGNGLLNRKGKEQVHSYFNFTLWMLILFFKGIRKVYQNDDTFFLHGRLLTEK